MWGAITQAIDNAAGRMHEGMGSGIKVASSQTPSQAASMDEPVYAFTSPSEGDTTEISSTISKKIESAKKAAKAKAKINEVPKSPNTETIPDNSSVTEAPKAVSKPIDNPPSVEPKAVSSPATDINPPAEPEAPKAESEVPNDILKENIKNSIKNGEDLYSDGINTKDSTEVLNRVKDVTKNAIKESVKNSGKHAAEAIKSDAKKAAEKGAKKTMERWNLKPKEKTTDSVDNNPPSAEPEKTNVEDYKPAKMMADRIRDVTKTTIKDIINSRKNSDDDSLSDKNAKSAKLLSDNNKCLAKKAAENTVKNWHKQNFKSNTKEGK